MNPPNPPNALMLTYGGKPKPDGITMIYALPQICLDGASVATQSKPVGGKGLLNQTAGFSLFISSKNVSRNRPLASARVTMGSLGICGKTATTSSKHHKVLKQCNLFFYLHEFDVIVTT